MLYAAAVKVKIQVDQRPAAMAQLAQAADGLHPAEALLDQLALPLTDGVAGMARRAAIDRAAAGARRVLRDMRRDVHRAQLGDEVARVVRLVGRRR